MKRKQPNQPTYTDKHGVRRFQGNEIIEYLVQNDIINLNDLAALKFSKEDQAQFAQLMGYSVSGWGDLSYVTNKKWKSVEGNE